MAGLALPSRIGSPVMQTAPALIASIAQRATSQVSIVALGPLTNLAEAFDGKPAWLSQIAGVTIMGGALDVSGNVGASGVGIDNPFAEWNIYIDPRAANLVLRSGVPVTLVPLDATNRVPITSRFLDTLGQKATQPAAKFVTEMLRNNQQFVMSGFYFFWDPLAAAIWTDESLASFETRTITVIEAEGQESGRTKADPAGVPVRAVVRADDERFEQQFIAGLNAP
jgi:pyrimidine-specific ribonucleoside hydrolase